MSKPFYDEDTARARHVPGMRGAVSGGTSDATEDEQHNMRLLRAGDVSLPRLLTAYRCLDADQRAELASTATLMAESNAERAEDAHDT